MLIFGTSNKNKLEEAKSILSIDLEGSDIEIEEIQSIDPKKVAIRKAIDYYNVIKKPLFIDDISLNLNGLNNLPGTYINDFLRSVGNRGLIELIKGKDRKATAITYIVYMDDKGVPHDFMGETVGSISLEEKGSNGFGWDSIFIPEGSNLTFAEMTLEEKNIYSPRMKALRTLKAYLYPSKIQSK